DRERQLDVLDDPVEEERALGGPELLRVLLGLRQRAQLVLELLANRADHRVQALLLEDQAEARAYLQLPDDVRLRRLDRQRRRQLVHQLLDDRTALAEPDLVEPLPDRVAVILLQLARQLEIEPLRLADLAAQILLRLADLADLRMCQFERLQEELLRNLFGSGLDHRQGLLRPDHDEV